MSPEKKEKSDILNRLRKFHKKIERLDSEDSWQLKALESIKNNETKYRSLFEDSPVSLWEEDFSAVKVYLEDLKTSGIPDFRSYFKNHPEEMKRCASMVKVVNVNRATVELLKFEKEELLKNLLLIFREETYIVFLEELVALAEGRKLFESEAVNRKRDGEKLYVTLRLAVVPGHEDTWSRVLISFTDITERKRAEEEVREKSKQLEALYELGKKVTTIISMEELLPWIAEEAKKLLDADLCSYRLKEGDYLVRGGGTREGLELMSKEKIKIGEGVGGLAAELKKPIIISENLADEPKYLFEHEKKTGRSSFRSFLGVPMMINGDIKGVLNVYTKKPRRFTDSDVELLVSFAGMAAVALENARLFKDLEKTKKELEESGKVLEDKVEERTRELKEIHNQLIHAERLAATGRLGASVAHEINNPLQAIENFISLVMENIDNESQDKRYLILAQEGIDRIAKIVRQLLTFHHPETARVDLIDINGIVEKVLGLTSNQLSINKIRVTKELSPSEPKIHGSSQQMHQVLLNLILNAQDSMLDGGELRIKTENGEEAASIFIKDTGVGMSEEVLAHIFEPFFTTKKKKMGTGLGLSVSHGIIRAHGGDIHVESKEGEGTTFIIRLPINHHA
jgi:PAS domain S-box-containing protein